MLDGGDERRKEALQEYFFVEQIIDNFDNRALQIKSWSVTVSGVALGAGFTGNESSIFLLASGASLVFWYIEATWKSFQRIMIDRAAEQLERVLANSPLDYSGPKIDAHFVASFAWKEKWSRFPKVFFYDNTFLPHLPILIVGLALFFLQ